MSESTPGASRGGRKAARIVTGLVVAGSAVAGAWVVPALAATGESAHHPQSRAVGSVLTNSVTAPDSNCVAGTESGCTTSTTVVAPATPMVNPGVGAGGAVILGGVLFLRRRRRADQHPVASVAIGSPETGRHGDGQVPRSASDRGTSLSRARRRTGPCASM